MRHDLKEIPGAFQAMWEGKKPFHISRNRGYSVGDSVVFHEYEIDSTPPKPTGRTVEGFIGYITGHAQAHGMVVFSLLNIQCKG